ncbi:MAG: PACE efflux transporter [Cellvibrio sp.]|uniref:PACE efflux transporter n=1 Tax=Cellvibrio sp. TaxID=1965322 RepID=UPI0031ADED14
MQGLKRRVVYVGLYEFIAIVLSALLLKLISSAGTGDSLGIAVAASAIAIVWNLVFNYGFERWEQYRQRKGRSIGVRVLHALGFEGGLLIFLVPVIALWLDISFMEALILDMGLLAFFLFYTFIFNWVFDTVFGLPASVITEPAH